MHMFSYYYLFSITKGTFEFVTTDYGDLKEMINTDDSLIQLSKKSDNHYLDFETTEELITGQFSTSQLLNLNTCIYYQINEKSGEPTITMNDIISNFSFRNKLHKQNIVIYNSYKQINVLM